MTRFLSPDSLLIPGPAGQLELRLVEPAGAGVLAGQKYKVVICHPHPQHGGSMDNKVVTTLMRSYRDLGIRVITFNFRGVGGSEGHFDQGRGELADLLAIVQWCHVQYPAERLMLAGFSFGSAIVAQASHELPHVKHLLLVAPPIERYAYDSGGRFPCPVTVVIGARDERVDVAGVYTWVDGLSSSVQLIDYPEAGHFFHGFLTQLKTDVSENLQSQFI